MKTKTKYKETEIGEIPEDWGVKKISEFCNIVMGQSPPSSSYNFKKEGLPFFQGRKDFGMKYPIKSVWCSEPSRIANAGDVLLSVRAPIGDVNIAVEKCCIGRGVSALSMREKNKGFLYYLIVHNRQRLKQIFESEGTVFGCITKAGLRDFEVALPEQESEQKAIAKILSDLDSKIELNNQMNKTLEAIGQALFKRWFVDFEFPNENGKPYKSSGGKMIDSELGKIPEGWTITKLGDIGAFKNGINYLRNETGDTDFFITNVRDIANNKLLLKNSLDKIKINASKAKDYLLQEKDILIARSASPGEISLVLGDLEKVIYSGFSIRYRLNEPNNYLYIFYIMQGLKRNLQNYSIGTTLQSVNQETLRNIKFIWPSDEALKEFNKISKKILEKTLNNLMQNRELSQIRDSLLPRLMSGKIRIPVEAA